MSKCIIVIPTHEEHLTLTAKIALDQVIKVLPHYKKAFVIPKSSRADFLTRYHDFQVFRVSNAWFGTIEKYNEMSLSVAFYELFVDYEYILIYHFDSFVFRDDLNTFCEMGFDYIGAPMPRNYWIHCPGRVGNGGLSLRKVQSFIKLLSKRDEIMVTSGIASYFKDAEDEFFAYCGSKSNINFSVPPISVAIKFSVEGNVSHAFQNIYKGELPFGCHRWSDKRFFGVWRSHIAHFVDNIDAVTSEVYSDGPGEYLDYHCRCGVLLKLQERIKKYSNKFIVKKILNECFPVNNKFILWGWGIMGKEAFDFCQTFEISVICIFDNSFICAQDVDGIIVQPFNKEMLNSSKCNVLISTTRYQNQISDTLKKGGLKDGVDFFSYERILQYLVKKLIFRRNEFTQYNKL